VQFVSTRGHAPECDFRGVLLAGLANDGGLYVPKELPQFSVADISRFATVSYSELAYEIMRPFVAGTFDDVTLKRMIDDAYRTFRHTAVAPLYQRTHRHYVLELFHGPTLAFKDFALQLLGRMMEALLKDTAQKTVVLGATSGDTGSAAIAGFRGKATLEIAILYPKGRTSIVQRKQMTTLPDANVHPLQIDGTFDDCQNLVKQAFADQALRARVPLVAVNSINFARILAQTVYYFYAACALGAPARRVNFCVPTGNFGDIYAGYLAKKMGLPMGKLVIASNQNDILTRALHTGNYGMHGVVPTHSPSMDIQISSNFERLLFDLYDQDGPRIAQMMQEFRDTQSLSLSAQAQAAFAKDFAAHAIDDVHTLATMRELYDMAGIALDPHTAVGIAAADACADVCADGPIVTLATAHAAKFPDAAKKAGLPEPALPPYLADLHSREERIIEQANDYQALTARLEALCLA
jgi:threonine synthase